MGTDEIASYSLGPTVPELARQQVPAAKVQPGAGARHFVFHGSGSVFVCNELDSSVTVMSYDGASGTLAYKSHETTCIDPDRTGDAHCGAIRLSPDDRFVYVANRARQSIAVFEAIGGGLQPVAECACPGIGARDMWVADDAVYVAFASSDKLEVFERDRKTGTVGGTIQTIAVPVPMFVLPLDVEASAAPTARKGPQ
jgi:6-phosphogluconolactonase